MATTAQSRYEDRPASTRLDLLWAAYEEIYHHGFQGARINRMFAGTSLTKGALYHHFPGKLDLGYAVVDECLTRVFRKTWIEPLDDTNDPIETLRGVLGGLKAAQERAVELGCPANNLAQEMSPVDEGFRVRINELLRHWRDAIEHALKRGQKAGLVRNSVDAKSSALFIVASVEGCIGMGKNAKCQDTLDTCLKGISDVLEHMKA